MSCALRCQSSDLYGVKAPSFITVHKFPERIAPTHLQRLKKTKKGNFIWHSYSALKYSILACWCASRQYVHTSGCPYQPQFSTLNQACRSVTFTKFMLRTCLYGSNRECPPHVTEAKGPRSGKSVPVGMFLLTRLCYTGSGATRLFVSIPH